MNEPIINKSICVFEFLVEQNIGKGGMGISKALLKVTDNFSIMQYSSYFCWIKNEDTFTSFLQI